MSSLATDFDEKAVVQEITALIEAEFRSPKFRTEFKNLVEHKAFVPQVIFAVAQATNRTHNFEVEAVRSFAKAMHLFGIASRLFDDLIDDDKETSVANRLGIGRTISLALADWMVAERYLTELGGAEKFVEALHTTFLRALETQYEELDAPGQELSVEQSIERAGRKTGLYMQTAFEIACWLAGGSSDQICKYRAVGYRLGVMDQLYNDAKDCFEPNARRNTLQAGQFCLPLSYGLRNESADAQQIRQLWQAVVSRQNRPETEMERESNREASAEESHKRLLTLLGKTGAFVCTELTLHQLYLEVSRLLDEQKKGEDFLLQVARHYLLPLHVQTTQKVTVTGEVKAEEKVGRGL